MAITITENEMAHTVQTEAKAQGIEITIEDAGKILDIFEDIVKASVAAGVDVKMRHFGTFTKVDYKARNRYNPATKQTEMFPASVAPKFEPSDEFRALLNA